jgi:hypothetical protein
LVSGAGLLEEGCVLVELLHHPISDSGAVAAAGARKVEDEIGTIVEAVLPPNGLDIVRRERPACEPMVQLVEQVFLTPGVESIHVLRLQRRSAWIVHDSDGLQICSRSRRRGCCSISARRALQPDGPTDHAANSSQPSASLAVQHSC